MAVGALIGGATRRQAGREAPARRPALGRGGRGNRDCHRLLGEIPLDRPQPRYHPLRSLIAKTSRFGRTAIEGFRPGGCHGCLAILNGQSAVIVCSGSGVHHDCTEHRSAGIFCNQARRSGGQAARLAGWQPRRAGAIAVEQRGDLGLADRAASRRCSTACPAPGRRSAT